MMLYFNRKKKQRTVIFAYQCFVVDMKMLNFVKYALDI